MNNPGYRTSLEMPAEMIGKNRRIDLDLGQVAIMAEVRLNGSDLGILWKPPFRLDVTEAIHAGRNALEIKVVNLWINRMIGDEQLPDDSPDSKGASLTDILDWTRRGQDWLFRQWPRWLLDGKSSPSGRFTFTTFRHWKKIDSLVPSGLLGPVQIKFRACQAVDGGSKEAGIQGTPSKPSRNVGLTNGPNATVLKDGKPYRGLGINYHDCFLRTLKKDGDTSYEAGFATLTAKGIPFARFCATGFFPKEMKLYQTDRAEYFRRLDGVVRSAEKWGIGLVPSLFWYYACVPDLVGEPMDQWGNPQSKTHAWMREYVREVVTRYRDNPTIWAWEFGNEYSLIANLPNAKDHRPWAHTTLGQPATRSERDDITFAMVRVAVAEFGKAVREYDPKRLILSGDTFKLSAWHQEHENTWTKDTPEQFAEMLKLANPDPLGAISMHVYDEDEVQQFAAMMKVSRKLNKPVFVGEFGAQGETPEQAAKCRRLLKAILDHDIPLAALWVFDFETQKEWSVTADNARAWQLDLISEANKGLLKAATAAP